MHGAAAVKQLLTRWVRYEDEVFGRACQAHGVELDSNGVDRDQHAAIPGAEQQLPHYGGPIHCYVHCGLQGTLKEQQSRQGTRVVSHTTTVKALATGYGPNINGESMSHMLLATQQR
jgi:hypothetical protein